MPQSGPAFQPGNVGAQLFNGRIVAIDRHAQQGAARAGHFVGQGGDGFSGLRRPASRATPNGPYPRHGRSGSDRIAEMYDALGRNAGIGQGARRTADAASIDPRCRIRGSRHVMRLAWKQGQAALGIDPDQHDNVAAPDQAATDHAHGCRIKRPDKGVSGRDFSRGERPAGEARRRFHGGRRRRKCRGLSARVRGDRGNQGIGVTGVRAELCQLGLEGALARPWQPHDVTSPVASILRKRRRSPRFVASITLSADRVSGPSMIESSDTSASAITRL